jgi:hypothetical protein
VNCANFTRVGSHAGFLFRVIVDESGAIRSPAPHVRRPPLSPTVQQMFLSLMLIVICVIGGAWSLVLHAKFFNPADSIVVYNDPS